ncbi:hypothetical protein C8R46DRAFT_1159923 [Mycena filopes]|nr:hypothetical protein C8R46DRAFT_1159923 [Mycena filopes]
MSSLSSSAGFRSPPRSDAASPAPLYTKTLLSTTLHSAIWPDLKERDKVKAWIKEIGDRVKTRMVEIQPTGFKYIVLTQINENLGQGGRADMACHWEDSDTVVQEMFSNDSLICICIAFAIRSI